LKRIGKRHFFNRLTAISLPLNLELLCTLMAIGINEELSIDILSQTPLIALCLNVANDAEKKTLE